VGGRHDQPARQTPTGATCAPGRGTSRRVDAREPGTQEPPAGSSTAPKRYSRTVRRSRLEPAGQASSQDLVTVSLTAAGRLRVPPNGRARVAVISGYGWSWRPGGSPSHAGPGERSSRGQGSISTSSPHALQPDGTASACAGAPARARRGVRDCGPMPQHRPATARITPSNDRASVTAGFANDVDAVNQ